MGGKSPWKKVGLSSYRVGIMRCRRVGGLIFLSRPCPPNNVPYVSTCTSTYKRLTELTKARFTMQMECRFKTRRYSLRLSDIESDHRVYSGFFLEAHTAKRPDSLSKASLLCPPNAPSDVHTIVGIVTIRRRRCFMVSSLKCRFSRFRQIIG